MNNFLTILKHFSELSKLRITFFVAVSALLGYILADGEISAAMLLPSFGVLLLACGSAALNQLQEKDSDAKMKRTQNRPLPAKKLSPMEALIFIVASSILGLFLLALTGSIAAVVLGVLSFLWYNAIYTPLKKKTALAVFPGAVLGALPPMIGWASAGGALGDAQILALATFFFLWQIPHFWFLFLIYDEDYKSGGYPTLTEMFTEKQVMRISFSWLVSLAVSGMIIPYFALTSSLWSFIVLFVFGAILIWRTKGLVIKSEVTLKASYGMAFRDINIYVLFVVIILILDKLINH